MQQQVQTANLPQSDTLKAIHARVCNIKPMNAAAKGKQLEFKLWYDNLDWYGRMFEPKTLISAHNYENIITEANKLEDGDAFGVDFFGADANPVLRRGSKGEAVKRWQRLIGAPVDGDFGPTTDRLTREWQKKNGLKVDGVVGEKTWGMAIGNVVQDTSTVKTTTPPAAPKSMKEVLAAQRSMTTEQMKAVNPNVVYANTATGKPQPVALMTASGQPILRRGSKGPDVGRWQKIIGADIDNAFGPQTEALTKAWQKRVGVAVDGVVDDPDWAAAVAAPKTTVADLKAAAPAVKQNNGELPTAIAPATQVVKDKAKETGKKVKETATRTIIETRTVIQAMPLWQRVLTGIAVVGGGIMGVQLITGKKTAASRTATTGPMTQFRAP